jgi:hypothetical protein
LAPGDEYKDARRHEYRAQDQTRKPISLTMKDAARIIILILPLALNAMSSPLQKEQVTADAKWVLHLDVDALRSTSLGDFVINQVLAAKLGSLTREFDFDLDWKKVASLTAYGTGYESEPGVNGVLLVNTVLDLQKVLDDAIAKTAQETNNKSASIQKTSNGEVTTYSLKDHLFVSFKTGRPVIVSKALNSIQKADEVLAGKSPNLASTKTFSEFPASQTPFFFMGAVNAFKPNPEPAEGSHDGDSMNPKAKILKLADGGRVVLGEDSNQLFLDLSLKAKSTEVVTQMQQVIQGMIALASLSQPDNKDLQALAQSAKVSSVGNIVTLKLGYPADQAVSFLSSTLNNHQEHQAVNGGNHGMKHKSKRRPAADDAAETDDK